MSALLPTWLLSSFQSSESNRFPRLSSSYFQFGSVCRISYDLENHPARRRHSHKHTASPKRERERVTRVYPVLTYSYRLPGMNRADGWSEGEREGWILPWYVTGRCNQEQFTNSARCIGTDLLPSRNLVISIVSMNNVVQSSPAIPPLSMPRFFVPRGRARIDLFFLVRVRRKDLKSRSKQSFIYSQREEGNSPELFRNKKRRSVRKLGTMSSSKYRGDLEGVKKSDARVVHPLIRLGKGNGCNKRMIRPICTYFQSVITDPGYGYGYGEKRGGQGRESWPALGLLASRDAMFNWQLFSLAHRNRSEGGRAGGAGGGAGLLSRVRAARGERSGARVPVGGCQWRRGAWLGQRVVPRKGDAE